jgi:hypothetical protein
MADDALPGTAFCACEFFHSLTGVATYVADALRLELTAGHDRRHCRRIPA